MSADPQTDRPTDSATLRGILRRKRLQRRDRPTGRRRTTEQHEETEQ